jgi:hypothetical protein
VRVQDDRQRAVLRRHAQVAVILVRRQARRGAAHAAPLLALVLASCGVTTDQRACPTVEVIASLNRLVQFRGAGHDQNDVAFVARVGDVRSRCTYEESNVTTDLSITFVGQRGPAGAQLPSAEITYFIAVIDGERHIITKKSFSDRLLFDDKGQARIADDLQEKLPTNPIKSASDHSVIVGFQLTADQINLNETQPDR